MVRGFLGHETGVKVALLALVVLVVAIVAVIAVQALLAGHGALATAGAGFLP